MHPQLAVEKLSASYGAKTVFDDVSFRLEKGRIGCLLGPSGCGKTTLLRCIAGFEPVRSGRILLDGRPATDGNRMVAPENRGVGMVFQKDALFPHLTAAENAAFGLAGLKKKARTARAMSLLDLVGLADCAGRYPHELSGGQRQRVALARSLARGVGLILLDEPFSNLDAALRDDLGRQVREVIKGQGMTALLVTHSHREAFAMADDIGVVSEGRLLQWGEAAEVYRRPVSPRAAFLLGEGCTLRGRALDDGGVECGLGRLGGGNGGRILREDVDVLVRPEHIVPDDRGAVVARVIRKTFRGGSTLYTLRLPTGEEVLSLWSGTPDAEPGQEVRVRHLLADPILFDRSAETVRPSAPPFLVSRAAPAENRYTGVN